MPQAHDQLMKTIPESHQDLLKDDAQAFSYLATLTAGGAPQVTPVWFNTDGEYILINTVVGRIKDKNMRARPKIALCIADPSDPYRYLQIRGQVVESTKEGAEEHIDVLNLKYRGNPHYPKHSPDQPRIIYKIQPEKVDPHG